MAFGKKFRAGRHAVTETPVLSTSLPVDDAFPSIMIWSRHQRTYWFLGSLFDRWLTHFEVGPLETPAAI
jgi:hypothetical protein